VTVERRRRGRTPWTVQIQRCEIPANLQAEASEHRVLPGSDPVKEPAGKVTTRSPASRWTNQLRALTNGPAAPSKPCGRTARNQFAGWTRGVHLKRFAGR
jgi:hypothetical protein